MKNKIITLCCTLNFFTTLVWSLMVHRIAQSTNGAPQSRRQSVKCPDEGQGQGIAYGNDSPSQKLRVYPPENKVLENRPVLIFIHGGAWSSGCKENVERSKILEYFHAKHSMPVVSIDFRVVSQAPFGQQKNTWQTQMNDIAKAVSWIHNNAKSFGGNSNELVLLGFSSGGHNASLLVSDPNYLTKLNVPITAIKGVISLDVPALDLLNALEIAPSEKQGKMYTKNLARIFSSDPVKQALASPANHILKFPLHDHKFPCRSNFPQFLIFSANQNDQGQEHNFTPRTTESFYKVAQSRGICVKNKFRKGKHLALIMGIGDEQDIVTQEINGLMTRLGLQL